MQPCVLGHVEATRQGVRKSARQSLTFHGPASVGETKMKFVWITAALVCFASINSADAGLFHRHGSNGCGCAQATCAAPAPTCAAPAACAPSCGAPAAVCAPAAPSCCAPAPTCCNTGCNTGCHKSHCFKMPKFHCPKIRCCKARRSCCNTGCSTGCAPTCAAPAACAPTCAAPAACGPTCAAPVGCHN